jgi:hypothetical protein
VFGFCECIKPLNSVEAGSVLTGFPKEESTMDLGRTVIHFGFS